MDTVGGAGGAGAPLVARAVQLTYWRRQRATALRWSALNAALLLLFAYDLSCKCPGYTSAAHYVELALAGAAAAALLQHARTLLPSAAPQPAPAAPLTLSPTQRRLLGLQDTPLDSSFRLVEEAGSAGDVARGAGAGCGEELSVCGRREWRARPASSPAAPSPSAPPSPPAAADRDRFIADRHSLTDYLREYESRARVCAGGAGVAAGGVAGGRAPPRYQLASARSEGGGGAGEECAAGGAAGGGGSAGAAAEGGAGGAARLCWRLHLDPRRLTEFNLNLRLWVQVTILERVVREMDAVDAALARLGLPAHGLGEVSVERLRALAGAGGSLSALLPFLEPFSDQRYVVRRIRALARGGALSEYRWCGGGPGWDDARPADAELLLALLAAYLDSQLPQPPARPFSSLYLSAEGEAGSGGALRLHRMSRRPPHYVVVWGEEVVDVGAGRANLLHALLVLLAAAARRDPPALGRMHLGPAGLNMLWIIGR